MQAIILAAGFGSRLRPLTDKMPKSLTEINGTPLLVNALTHLSSCGIDETIIVVGHMREKIIEQVGFKFNNMKITYVENSLYRETNNVYSLFLCKEYINDDVILMECDLFYREKLIKTILNGTSACDILVSKYNEKTMDGTVISCDTDNRVQQLIVKKQQTNGFNFQGLFKTVNVYRFSRDFILNKYFPALALYVNTQSCNSYYELVLGGLIYFGNENIKAVFIDESEWAEVDSIEDLEAAENKFKRLA